MTVKTKKETRGRKLRTYFDGKELRDATVPLSIPVLPGDLAAAEAVRSGDVNDPKRFTDCLVAQACNRVFGEDAHVAIMRRTAWVSLPKEKHAIRFSVGAEAHRIIAGFDRGEPVELGTMLHLDVPPESYSLERHRKNNKAWHKRNPQFNKTRKTRRKQAQSDPLHGVIRNGVYVRV